MKWSLICALGLLTLAGVEGREVETWRLASDGSPEGGRVPAFRMADQEVLRSTGQTVNLGGLDRLRLSGSGQFTLAGLDQLVRALSVAPKDLVLLDLRAEPHAFLNGIAVFWHPWDLRVEVQPTAPELLLRLEGRQLQKTLSQSSVELWRVGDDQWLSRTRIVPKEGQTQERAALQRGIRYARIPLSEKALPTAEQVDALVDQVRRLDGSDWLHVHDNRGRDRTTLVMIMVDMMFNARNVPFQDILTRQMVLGGSDLQQIPTDPEWDPQPWDRFYPPSEIVPPYRNDAEMWGNNMLGNNPLFQNDPLNPFYLPYDPMVFELEIPQEQWGNPALTQDRLDFLQTFYAYCREQLVTGFRTPYSQWLTQGIVFELSAHRPINPQARLLRSTWRTLFHQPGFPLPPLEPAQANRSAP
jgi:hypothetical protein